jgi:methyltransferase
MISLGKFWTLRKLVLPGVLLFKRGPYKFIKEPYHIISLVQLYIVPLLFGAYITALVFPLVYLFIFQVKLPERGGTFSKAPL